MFLPSPSSGLPQPPRKGGLEATNSLPSPMMTSSHKNVKREMRRGCIEGSWGWWGVGGAGLRNGDGEGYADHNQSPCSHLSKIQVGTYHPMLKLFLDWRANPNQELLCTSLHGLALRSLISAGHKLPLSLLCLYYSPQDLCTCGFSALNTLPPTSN